MKLNIKIIVIIILVLFYYLYFINTEKFKTTSISSRTFINPSDTNNRTITKGGVYYIDPMFTHITNNEHHIIINTNSPVTIIGNSCKIDSSLPLQSYDGLIKFGATSVKIILKKIHIDSNSNIYLFNNILDVDVDVDELTITECSFSNLNSGNPVINLNKIRLYHNLILDSINVKVKNLELFNNYINTLDIESKEEITKLVIDKNIIRSLRIINNSNPILIKNNILTDINIVCNQDTIVDLYNNIINSSQFTSSSSPTNKLTFKNCIFFHDNLEYRKYIVVECAVIDNIDNTDKFNKNKFKLVNTFRYDWNPSYIDTTLKPVEYSEILTQQKLLNIINTPNIIHEYPTKQTQQTQQTNTKSYNEGYAFMLDPDDIFKEKIFLIKDFVKSPWIVNSNSSYDFNNNKPKLIEDVSCSNQTTMAQPVTTMAQPVTTIVQPVTTIVQPVTIIASTTSTLAENKSLCDYEPSGETPFMCIANCNNDFTNCNPNECSDKCNNCKNEVCRWNNTDIKILNSYKPPKSNIRAFAGNNMIKITWLKPSSLNEITNYYIIVSEKKGGDIQIHSIINANTELMEYIIHNLKNEIVYDVNLISKNKYGISDISNTESVIPNKDISFNTNTKINKYDGSLIQQYYDEIEQTQIDFNNKKNYYDKLVVYNELKDILINKLELKIDKNLYNINVL